MMYPNPRNRHNFKFPAGHFLSLHNVKDDELRKPTMYDQNNNRCIVVLKRGRTIGLTVSRANTIFSYARNYFGDGRSPRSGRSCPTTTSPAP